VPESCAECFNCIELPTLYQVGMHILTAQKCLNYDSIIALSIKYNMLFILTSVEMNKRPSINDVTRFLMPLPSSHGVTEHRTPSNMTLQSCQQLPLKSYFQFWNSLENVHHL